MKKVGWVLGTAIACVLWFVLSGFIGIGVSLAISIATRSELARVQGGVIHVFMPIMLLGCIAVILLSAILCHRWGARCPACKRWGAMKLVQTALFKQEDISIRMELEQRNLSGQVTGTHDQYIPGQRHTYGDTYRCKYCGNRETRMRTEKKASI